MMVTKGVFEESIFIDLLFEHSDGVQHGCEVATECHLLLPIIFITDGFVSLLGSEVESYIEMK